MVRYINLGGGVKNKKREVVERLNEKDTRLEYQKKVEEK